MKDKLVALYNFKNCEIRNNFEENFNLYQDKIFVNLRFKLLTDYFFLAFSSENCKTNTDN